MKKIIAAVLDTAFAAGVFAADAPKAASGAKPAASAASAKK